MKKKTIPTIIAAILTCTVAIVLVVKNNSKYEETSNTDHSPDNTFENNASEEIKGLEFEWWTIKTNTGIPTFIAEVKNINKKPASFNFNVDYYLNGEKTQTSQDLNVVTIAPENTILIWDTWKIPEYADDIIINYSYLGESTYYVPVTSSVTNEKKENGTLNLSYSVAENFEELDADVAYFLNGKLVAFDQHTFFSGEKLELSSEPLEHYDSYKLYTNAYKTK